MVCLGRMVGVEILSVVVVEGGPNKFFTIHEDSFGVVHTCF